jgi:hypothetical protein
MDCSKCCILHHLFPSLLEAIGCRCHYGYWLRSWDVLTGHLPRFIEDYRAVERPLWVEERRGQLAARLDGSQHPTFT